MFRICIRMLACRSLDDRGRGRAVWNRRIFLRPSPRFGPFFAARVTFLGTSRHRGAADLDS
jgi:hypothetical protein